MTIELSLNYDINIIPGVLNSDADRNWSFTSNNRFLKCYFPNGIITLETLRKLYDADGELICKISEDIFNSAYSAAKLFLEDMPRAIINGDYKMVMSLLPHLITDNADPNIEYICAPIREDLQRKYFQNYYIESIGVYKPAYEELSIFEVRKDTDDLGTTDDPEYILKHLYPGLIFTNS